MLKLKSSNKDAIFEEVRIFLSDNNIDIEDFDLSRPWGGFFVIKQSSLEIFNKLFFLEVNISDLALKLSPKILIVAPNKRLSWQYHFRRSEIWKLISGEAGIVRSDTDQETALETLQIGQLITLKQGERHRLVGLNHWGVVAEIWQHSNAHNPSNEDDIVRLQDDFGR